MVKKRGRVQATRLGGNSDTISVRLWLQVGTRTNITSKRVGRRIPTGLSLSVEGRSEPSGHGSSVASYAEGTRRIARARTWIDKQAWILAASGTPESFSTSSSSSSSYVANTEDRGSSVERHSLHTFFTFSISTTSSSIVGYSSSARNNTTTRTASPTRTPTPRTPLPKTPRLGTQRFVCGQRKIGSESPSRDWQSEYRFRASSLPTTRQDGAIGRFRRWRTNPRAKMISGVGRCAVKQVLSLVSTMLEDCPRS